MMERYYKSLQDIPVSSTLLYSIPHKRITPPTGMIIITKDVIPPLQFSLCPLFFANLGEKIPGKNPHDVIVYWDKSKGSLDIFLHRIYDMYKYRNIESNDDSMKRYIMEGTIPKRKIIIPSYNREENLRAVLKRFGEIDVPVEGYHPYILIVEHSPQPTLEKICSEFNVEWIWFEYNENSDILPITKFSRALCFDKGFIFGYPAEWYLFHDNDLLVPKDFWSRLDQNINRTGSKYIQPYTNRAVTYLDKASSMMFRTNTKLANDSVPKHMTLWVPPGLPDAAGGSIYLQHDSYVQVGGHDPQICWGYAPEDAIFMHKLRLFEPTSFADDPPIEMIHLWHMTSAFDNPFLPYMNDTISQFTKQNLEQLHTYLNQKRQALNSVLPENRKVKF